MRDWIRRITGFGTYVWLVNVGITLQVLYWVNPLKSNKIKEHDLIMWRIK